jgi:O-antigen/teichoic acid export membrane protein
MRLLTGSAINSSALAIASGVNFLSLFIWTRLLDPEAFGIYAIALASALLLNAVTFEWLRLVGARTLYDRAHGTQINPDRASALFLLYLATSLAFAAAGMIPYALGVGFVEIGPEWWPILVALTLGEMALAIINTISRVRLHAWQYFRSLVARSVLTLALGLILVVGLGMQAEGVIVGAAIATVVVAVSSLILDPLWRTIRPWRARRAEIADIFQYGYPLIASCALTYAAAAADRFLIGAELGATEVGLYAAPADLVRKTLVFVMMAINVTAYPVLVRTYEARGPAAARVALERNFLLQLGLGLPAAIGLGVLAPGIVNLLLGEPFRQEGAILLPYIVVAALLRCLLTFHLTMAFQVVRQTKLMLVPPLITLIIVVPAAIVAMRSFGLLGMALAAISAQVAAYVVTVWLAKRVLDIRILTVDSLKILAAGAVMGGVLVPFRDADGPGVTCLLVAAGGLTYAAMLMLLRVEPVFAALRRLWPQRKISHTEP